MEIYPSINVFGKALEISKPYLERKESQGFAHRLVGDLLRYEDKEKEAQKNIHLLLRILQ